VEAIRALMVAKRSARNERTQTINQARGLILTGPDDLRERFAGHAAAALAEAIAALRPRPGDAAEYAIRVALRELLDRRKKTGQYRGEQLRLGRQARSPVQDLAGQAPLDGEDGAACFPRAEVLWRGIASPAQAADQAD
jgi:hypothetical protein